MGTKRNPGRYDCYAAAEDDEPLFVIRGLDHSGAALVRHWAELRPLARPERRGQVREAEKIAETHRLAHQMEAWQRKKAEERRGCPRRPPELGRDGRHDPVAAPGVGVGGVARCAGAVQQERAVHGAAVPGSVTTSNDDYRSG